MLQVKPRDTSFFGGASTSKVVVQLLAFPGSHITWLVASM